MVLQEMEALVNLIMPTETMNHMKDVSSSQATRTHLLTNERGQSAIEFILVIGFALGVTFLFMAQTFNATKGYLLHYATFTASRVYLTYDVGTANIPNVYRQAENRAKEQLDSFELDNVFGITADCKFENYQTTNALFTGTTCEFETATNFFPLIGGGDKAKLVSESFLGKEPIRTTCFEMLCQTITGESRTDCISQSESMDVTLYDNGC